MRSPSGRGATPTSPEHVTSRERSDAGTRKPDVVILDLGLSDGDGVDFIRDVRAWSQMPMVVLSARVDETDQIEALTPEPTTT